MGIYRIKFRNRQHTSRVYACTRARKVNDLLSRDDNRRGNSRLFEFATIAGIIGSIVAGETRRETDNLAHNIPRTVNHLARYTQRVNFRGRVFVPLSTFPSAHSNDDDARIALGNN